MPSENQALSVAMLTSFFGDDTDTFPEPRFGQYLSAWWHVSIFFHIVKSTTRSHLHGLHLHRSWNDHYCMIQRWLTERAANPSFAPPSRQRGGNRLGVMLARRGGVNNFLPSEEKPLQLLFFFFCFNRHEKASSAARESVTDVSNQSTPGLPSSSSPSSVIGELAKAGDVCSQVPLGDLLRQRRRKTWKKRWRTLSYQATEPEFPTGDRSLSIARSLFSISSSIF